MVEHPAVNWKVMSSILLLPALNLQSYDLSRARILHYVGTEEYCARGKDLVFTKSALLLAYWDVCGGGGIA